MRDKGLRLVARYCAVRALLPAVAASALVMGTAAAPAVAAAPVVSSFTPASGTIGTSVTITGTGLTGATGVTFVGRRRSSMPPPAPKSPRQRLRPPRPGRSR
jgi:hypothetical protein